MANNNGGGAHDDYLNAPDTAGRPMALVSLLLVFLVIAAAALALFLGGRWVYDQYVKDDETSQVATEQEMNQEVGTEEQTEGEGSGSGSDQPDTSDSSTTQSDGQDSSVDGNASSNDSETSSADESAGNVSGSSGGDNDSDEASSEGQSGSSSEEQQAAASTVTGPITTEEVPNTGPESMLAIFVSVTILAAILHRKWLINKL